MGQPPGIDAPLADELLRHGAWARRLARGLVGDEGAGEDALQDAFISAQRQPPDARAPLGPWLRTAVRHKVLNRLRGEDRRSARERAAGGGAAADSPEELLGRLEVHRVLVEAVQRLAEPYRQTVLLRYFEGLSSAQISERQSVPAGTVRGRLKTALGELREQLDARCGGRAAWWGALVQLAGGATSPAPPAGLALKLLLPAILLG